MNWKRLAGKAKQVVDDRGGTAALKEDAGELRDIAKGKESLTEKGKKATAALRDPGAPGGNHDSGKTTRP